MIDVKSFSSVYRIFNLSINSNLALPELPQAIDSGILIPEITFRLTHQPLTSVKKPHWFYHWYDDDDKTMVTIAVARQNGQYLLRFPDLADFMLDIDNSRIQCYPVVDTPVDTIRHLLLDQVIPRFLGQQGNLILHTSAITLQNGISIAFIGKSGWGKSTLASSFHQNGAQLITDDSMLLQENNGLLIGTPAYAGSRLWQDSADIVLPDSMDLLAVTHYSNKKRLILNNKTGSSTMEIQAIFLLDDPSAEIEQNIIKIEHLTGMDMIMAMLKQTFLIDPKDMSLISKHFHIASQITSINPALYSLNYPRDYDQLDELRAAILTITNRPPE